MNSFFPTSHGFRLASRRPSIPLAELAWRWSFAAAALTLSWLFLFEYLDSLRVTRGDRLLLISRQPVLVARAIHRIFQGSAFRFTEAGVLLGLGLAIAWIVLASLGRMAIVNSVLEEFGLAPRIKGRGGFSSLLALNVLRTAVMLAAFAGLMGATLLASSFWSSTHISAQDASRVFSLLVFFVFFTFVVLNWLLSVSAVFVIAERSTALDAVADVVRVCYEEPGPMLSTGILFGITHVAVFVAASGVGLFMFGALGSVRPVLISFAQFVLVAIY